MNEIKISVLGGDYRYKILKELLIEDGYAVSSFGSDFIDDNVNDIDALLKGCNVLVAPIPLSKDGKNVFLSGYTLKISDLLEKLKYSGTNALIGGVVSDDVKKRAGEYGFKAYDFFDFEEVSVANAIPTAEGAVMTAMRESERIIFGSNCLVIGYGRCGKVLSQELKGLGANVAVTYRKEGDGAYISAYGLNPVRFSEMNCCITKYDFIFNTAPSLVLDAALLKRLKQKPVIIDIAQAPGGVDYNTARALNIKALYCPGLPGRFAPRTAAEILKKTIIDIALTEQ
jgi:dipicolinate synthase subunit A